LFLNGEVVPRRLRNGLEQVDALVAKTAGFSNSARACPIADDPNLTKPFPLQSHPTAPSAGTMGLAWNFNVNPMRHVQDTAASVNPRGIHD
jgi:hypothetical protein